MIFKVLSVAKNCLRPESAPLNETIELGIKSLNFGVSRADFITETGSLLDHLVLQKVPSLKNINNKKQKKIVLCDKKMYPVHTRTQKGPGIAFFFFFFNFKFQRLLL